MRSFLLTLLCGLSSSAALAQWQTVTTPPGLGGELVGCQLDAVDDRTVWIINSFRYAQPPEVGIWRTIDGGQTWQTVTPSVPAGIRFFGGTCAALDAQHAWAVLDCKDATTNAILPSRLYSTADGGLSWTPRNLPPGAAGMFRPLFLTATEGLTVDGATSIIYRTTDGGQSWQPVSTQPQLRPNQQLYGVSSLQAAPGLLWMVTAAQSPVGPQSPGSAWISTDRGLTWRSQPLTGGAFPVFRDAQHALAVYSLSNMLTTSDGCQTWTPAAYPPFRASIIKGVPGSTAYVAGVLLYERVNDPRGSAVSYDEGQTWTLLENTNSYLGMEFTSPTAGWAVRATFDSAVSQYVFQGVARYNGPALLPQVTASLPARAAVPAEVFPNPAADGRFQVRLPAASRVRQVRVVDALGRTVYQAAALPADQRLDLSQQPKGLYSLEIQTDAGLVRRKLLTR